MGQSDVLPFAVSGEDVSDVVAACLELEQVRTIRRLLVARCGLVVVVVALAGTLIHDLSLFARWCSIALLATPPILTWIIEIRLAQRLERRLAGARKS